MVYRRTKVKVLVACEFSGIVREAFRAKGHNSWSCDLLPTEIPGQHIQGDVLKVLSHGWDLMIAHPPCTYLSNAGACRLYPQKGKIDLERYNRGLEAKEFFLTLLNANIAKICVENPVSSRVFNMPSCTQQIEPYQFGHPYTKKTRLWLRNLPELKSTNVVTPIAPYCPAGTSRRMPSKLGAAKRGEDAKNRSRFWTGIAEAMANQWG
jgi:hypothetical protein